VNNTNQIKLEWCCSTLFEHSLQGVNLHNKYWWYNKQYFGQMLEKNCQIFHIFRVTWTFVANIWEDCSWITYTKTKIIVITQWNVLHLVILQQNWAMYTPNKRWWMGDQVWIHTDNKYEVFFFLPNLSLLTFMLGIHFLWHIITLRKHNPFLLGECVKNWSVFWLFLTLYFNME
jgi:hypothetical protein